MHVSLTAFSTTWEAASPRKLYWPTETIQNSSFLMSIDSYSEPKHSLVAYFMLTIFLTEAKLGASSKEE